MGTGEPEEPCQWNESGKQWNNGRSIGTENFYSVTDLTVNAVRCCVVCYFACIFFSALVSGSREHLHVARVWLVQLATSGQSDMLKIDRV